MKCSEFQIGLDSFFRGNLDARLKHDLDAHADGCGPCGELMRTAYELTCKEILDFLDEYVGGTLPPDRRAAFDRHLAICVECTAYLDSYRKTVSLTREASTQPDRDRVASMPEGLIRGILSSLKKP